MFLYIINIILFVKIVAFHSVHSVMLWGIYRHPLDNWEILTPGNYIRMILSSAWFYRWYEYILVESLTDKIYCILTMMNDDVITLSPSNTKNWISFCSNKKIKFLYFILAITIFEQIHWITFGTSSGLTVNVSNGWR